MITRFQRELALITAFSAVFLVKRRRTKLGLSLGAAALALRFVPRPPSFNYRDKAVVITGGSRGLGLALAKELVRQGAYVTLLARDHQELVRAQAQLEAIAPDRSLAMVCDVTRLEQLAHALAESNDHYGRIDVLINNAGAITVGPYVTQEIEDYRAQMELHLYAVVEATRLVRCYMLQAGGGKIVNISSIGGKIPVPHLVPYCASKFALAGFSKSVEPELASEGIQVTTVFPSLMRTGSPIQAVFKGDHEKEYAWFAASDSAPGASLSPEKAARRILKAVQAGDSEIMVGFPAKLGWFAYALFPEITARLTRLVTRLLPRGDSMKRQTGAESSAWLNQQAWAKPLVKLNVRAQRRYNQLRKTDAKFNAGIDSSQ